MRRLLALLLLAGCAAPRPCTKALCVERLDGTMETKSWSGTVVATSATPVPPVPSDAEVTMRYGSAEFRRAQSRVRAEEGSAFRFTISTRAVASLAVTSGVVTVVPSTGAAAVTVAPGSTFEFPKPR